MKAALYLRISTNNLSQKDSIENQKQLLLDYIRQQGYTLYEIYIDIGSGTNSNRKAFKKLIQDAKQKKFDVVISKELSRLARNARISLEFKDVIMDKGIHIITLDNAINTVTSDKGISEYGLYAWIYENESRNTSRRIKDTMRTSGKNGRFVKAEGPLGYDVVDGKLIIRSDDSPDVVRRIFSLYIKGHGATYIARLFNKEGVKTPGQFKNKSNAGTLWHQSSIRKILCNGNFTGDLYVGKETTSDVGSKDKKRIKNETCIVVENTHEPIISKEDFETVQKIIKEKAAKSKKRATPKKYLFTDKLICNDCGKRLWHISDRSYYVCGTYKQFGADYCSIHRVNEKDLADVIQKDLKSFAKGYADKEEVLRKLKKQLENSKKENEKKLGYFEKKKEKINVQKGKLVLKLTDDIISKEEYDIAV